jgi:hypothetical protein
MFRQQDTEGTDVPAGGVSDAINARACGDYYEGRTGSVLFTPSGFGFTKTASAETIATSFTSGELYVANGSSALVVGDIFQVYGENDWTGAEMTTAKGAAPRKGDLFKVSNVTPSSEAVLYLGNIRNPALPGYGDTPATEFTASKSGTTITATVGTFDTTLVGCYFAWYDGTRDLITGWINSTAVKVKSTGTHASASKGVIHATMNASLLHKGVNRIVALFGRRIYVSSYAPFSGWTEVKGIVDTLDRPYDTAESSIHQFGDDAILVNPAGVYRIKLSVRGTYYWKTNTPVPTVKIADTDNDKTYIHKYRYTYALARLTGASMFKDRFDTASGVVIEQETAPVAIDINRVDYGDVLTTEPVGSGTKTYGKITGTSIDEADRVNTTWNAIDDGTLTLVINGEDYDISVDLTSVETIADVALRIQNAIRTIKDLEDVTVEFDNDHFIISTGEGDSFTSAAYAGFAGGTVITDNLKIDGVSPTTALWDTPLAIAGLTFPEKGSHLTHYSVYRTQDLGKENNGDPGLLAWVADIPILRPFTGSISGSTLTLTNGTIEKEDEGCTVTALDGTEFTITTYLTSTTATVSIATLSSQVMVIGGSTVFTASQSATALSVTGYSLSESDVGRQVFWADGGVSIIKSVTNATTAVTVNVATHGSQAAAAIPVSRSFTDTVSDEELETRYSSYPLRNRFQTELPGGAIGALVPGFLFTAARGSNRFNYCETAYPWLVGYYHRSFQKSEEIWDGIQCIIPFDGFCVIRGLNTIYNQSLLNFFNVGDPSVGESVSKLASVKVINEGFGSIGSGASRFIGLGREIFVTSEPGVRVNDGSTLSDNLAEKAIQRSDLNRMKQSYVAGFNSLIGHVIWGEQEDT